MHLLRETDGAASNVPEQPALVLVPESGPRPKGLVASGLRKRLRSGRTWTEVLKGLDLQAPGGAVVWVGGRNGMGKATLLRILSGILVPDDGSVRALGVDARLDRRTYQQQVGFLSAGDRGLYARIAVRRQLEYWARIAVNRRAERLSLGQRQRVRLALAFLHGRASPCSTSQRTALTMREWRRYGGPQPA